MRLEQCNNNVDAAQAHLLRRLRDDGVLLEALVKSAVEYERLEELHPLPMRARGADPLYLPAEILAQSRALICSYIDSTTGRNTSLCSRQPLSAAHTACGVSGICSFDAASAFPARARASATAFTTAGVAPIVPSSPTPFTPNGLFWQGMD